MNFEITNSAQDHAQLSPMAAASAEILETENLMVTADKGYDSASDVAACIMQGTMPHVMGADYTICLPVESCADESEITEHHDGRCVYLPERNVAICPMGKALYPSGYKKNHRAVLFRNGRACSSCQCKCTVEQYKSFEIRMPKTAFRKTFCDKDLYVRQIHIHANKEIARQRKSNR